MTLVQCGRSDSVTAASLVAQGVLCASLHRLVDSGIYGGKLTLFCSYKYQSNHIHCVYLPLYVPLLSCQVDSPAQLANALVNVTGNSEEIESADVSLTVGFLSVVANSIEDLQQEEVSIVK